MRIFAQKPEAAQKTRFRTPDRAHFGQSRGVSSILDLQRRMGNQAVQGSRQPYADTPQAGSAMAAPPGIGFNFGQIKIHSDGREHTFPGAAQTDSFGERTPSSVPVHSTMHRDCDCRGASGECHCSDSGLNRPAGHAARRPWHSCGLVDQDALTGVGIKPAELPLHDIREPRADSATIVCDGKGGYRVDLQAWAGAPCGLETCIRAHEESHIADWKGRWPDGCKDKANGAKIPLGGPGYDDFLKASECRAYTAELACNGRLLDAAKGDCVKTITDHRKADVAEQKQYCG
jgi:hypothetical protein